MQNQIRNFVIISHIDHGKSTLADRFLELTKTVDPKEMHSQFLDNMSIERERGITIRMQPVRMEYIDQNAISYILNLIDTPGHADFSYEVSRSLAAVEGALLLVDATRGIQAQTMSNLEMARKQNLFIIPVINKIDLPGARIEEVSKEISDVLHVNPENIFKISAKYGTGCEDVLHSICNLIPGPKINNEKPLKALIFDSIYDSYKGVIAYVRIIDGQIKEGDDIYLKAADIRVKVKEVGFFKPEFSPSSVLKSGEIGYIATGIKDLTKVRAGDTITLFSDKDIIIPFPGYQRPKPVVFASLFCQKISDYDILRNALLKLKLNDASLTFEPDSKPILGRGFKCGFLGQLHMEIVVERLRRDSNLDLIISFPSIVYKIIDSQNKEGLISSAQDWPNPNKIKETLEQYIRLKIIIPRDYLGKVMESLKNRDVKYINTEYLGSQKVILIYELPLRKIMFGFHQNLKNITHGYGSISYNIIGWRKSNLTKLEILIAGVPREELSTIVCEEDAYKESKNIVEKIKENFPQQLFEVPIQARVNGKIIARETVKARRKDVIAPLYGGDYTRKRKLLEKQKRGKKKLKEKTRLTIPPKVFFNIFKSDKF